MKEMKKDEHSWMSNEHSWNGDNWMSEENLEHVSGGADKINGGKVKTKADANVKLDSDIILKDKNVKDVATLATLASTKED